ncbi:MAG: hypothetical protein RIT26_1904 [Pseudomonadota bacterium]
MPSSLAQTHNCFWLACPTSARGLEAYWQAREGARMGGEARAWCLLPPGSEPPWDELRLSQRWRGLVLFEGVRDASCLWAQARQRQVPVWVWPGTA